MFNSLTTIGDSRRKIIIHIFCCSLIIFLCCINLSKLNYIAVLDDEFGYWGTAAMIAGYDWHELMAETAYYSYGYSLVLVPIILLFPTPIIWYKAAIFLNVFLLVLTYFICIQVGKELFPEVDEKLVFFVSMLVTIYPGNIIYAQVAWSETLQYFLIWIITYLMVKLDKKFSILNMLVTIIALVYLYCVHNRNIGVIAVAMLCFLLLFLKSGKSIIYFAVPVGALVLSYVLLDIIKNHEVSALWGNSSASEVNNFSVSGTMISKYFGLLFGNKKLYLISAYGKFFYLLLASGFTFPIALFHAAKEAVDNLRQKNLFQNFLISKVWCIGIIVMMWLLSALQMIYWMSRKDIIVYARYMEQALGPALFLGIIYALCFAKKLRIEILLSGILFLVGIGKVYQKIDSANSIFNSICAPLFGAFVSNNDSLEKAFIWIVVAMAVMIVGVIVSTFVKRKTVRLALPVIIYMIAFSVEGFYGGTYMNEARGRYEAYTLPIYEQITQFEQKEIFYVKDVVNDNPKFVQFMIPEHIIHIIDREQISAVTKNEALILINSSDEETETVLMMEENINHLVSTFYLSLYVKQDS